ncbi:MAG: penicillin-binding protein 2 [Pelagibacteraceae bacterium]|nr:penicillin-binding protein 2 [Pelagibacteraceae bacterium]MBT4645152.1 penicillin-binding protein 2 [Pelagibacteraceae bacterium]
MFYSEQKKQVSTYNRRTFILFLLKLSLFSTLGWRLYDIQIKNSSKYKTLSKKNQIDLEIIFPTRGKIFDRNNNIIATNEKVFDLYLIPENTKSINNTLNSLSKFVEIDFEKRRKIIDLSSKVRKFEKIKIFENITWSVLEKVESNKYSLQGIFIAEDYLRVYPYKEIFSHLLGYISKPNQKELSLPFISKMPNLDIGKEGLEKSYNPTLVGKPGQREIEVNSNGRIIREISKVDSIKGDEIFLSIDLRLQEYAYNLLKSYKAGSINIINIKTAEILCMISTPTYDPNQIVKKPNKLYWESILTNSLSPLTNRSIQGLYSPGSTFKMIVAIAALKHGLINSNTTHTCRGKIKFGNRLYHCWKTNGHGKMNVTDAIKQSCDVFFYEISKKVGIDKIAEVALDFGLGQSYDISMPNQKKGIIPNKSWKKNRMDESWYPGETLISAIGQGFVLTNPLQLAVMTSIIASNGKMIKPSILKNQRSNFKVNTKYSNEIKIIKEAMYKVVNENKGTAYKSRLEDVKFAGKTGTSQVKRISLSERESDDFRKKEKEWKSRDHALFVGYMPFDNPKFAISVVIEHGGSGASTAAPIASQIFKYIYNNKI